MAPADVSPAVRRGGHRAKVQAAPCLPLHFFPTNRSAWYPCLLILSAGESSAQGASCVRGRLGWPWRRRRSERVADFLLHWYFSWISSKFCSDLLVSPSTRDASVAHVIAAVASRSIAKAGEFVDEVWTQAGLTERKDKVKLHGSYDDIYVDPVSARGSCRAELWAEELTAAF